MRKIVPFLLLILLIPFVGQSQVSSATDEHVAVFRFESGQDGFYLAIDNNKQELARLYAFVDQYRSDIISGQVPVYVVSYSAGLPALRENLALAKIMANRVKSELIVHKGLKEEHFRTTNNARNYEGKASVLVTITVTPRSQPQPQPQPRPEPTPQPQPAPQPQPEPTPQPEPAPQPQPEPAPQPTPEPVKEPTSKPYGFALRWNALHAVALLPSGGIEWRVSENVGLKLDGAISYWSLKKEDIHRIGMVNPEVRFYMGEKKRFYLGAGFTYTHYSIRWRLLNNFVTDNTYYNGDSYGGGITIGYQAELSRRFSIDFNLGLGYTNFKYNTTTYADKDSKTAIGHSKDVSKDVWGPSQAGISLVWKFGGNTKK